ncbi:myelin-associated glycoprotein-like isoform X2 [Sebastes fasciatus]|uniref:myelin-associated glycoprotein-like isoform X2 n=1 Tax=Sebastes fasciatus TaxID=394691 RepID=UPI003D9F49F9
MSGALNSLLIACLLQGALCGEFETLLPQTMEVLSGSCVTIPCSFDVTAQHESNLDSTCKALWRNDKNTVVFDSSDPQQSTIKGELTGDLTRKDCTTTLNNMQPAHSNNYYFRIECNNDLKYNFAQQKISISVEADPPRPTLTPSTLKVKEGTSVRLKCSAPAPCPSHPPNLTWTYGLGDGQETLQENQDKTKVKTSVLYFTASHHHHGKTISCTAVYSKQDGSTESTVNTNLTADVSCALCGEFETLLPQTMEVLSGSCVTIPCSFDVTAQHESNLDSTCKALWRNDKNTVVFDSSDPQQSTIKGELTGDLTRKDCTTTLNNMQPDYSDNYYFRVECNNDLKYNFAQQKISISVKADPPRPTLTPSTLKVKEGTSVSLMCSAPAPCLSHPPNLTLTSGLGDSQETLQENQDKTKVKTSVVIFTASHHHHGKTISCTAVYNKQDGSTESAVSPNLTADVSFAPQILPSSDCTKAAAQLNCSCRTVGNPSPSLQWYLYGLPVNRSDRFAISNESLNDTGLKSIITVNQPQERDLSTLICSSSNSLGSTSQRFYIYSLEPQTSVESQDSSGRVSLPVFIGTVVALSAALICALLFAIRAQRTGCRNPIKSQCTGDTSTAVMSQGLTSEERNKVSITTEEDIYVNTSVMNNSNMANTHPGHQQVAGKSSEKKNEEGSDIVYSSVIWKSKSKKKKGEDCVDMHQPGSSYLEEERRMGGGTYSNYALELASLYDKVGPKNVEKEVESEYAQVQFRDKNIMHK